VVVGKLERPSHGLTHERLELAHSGCGESFDVKAGSALPLPSALELLSFPASRIRFVLNRANSKVGMKKKEVEGALNIKIGFEVPSDRAVPLGVNRGLPPAISDTGSDFAKAIRLVAKSLLTTPQEQTKKKRAFASLARA